MRTQSSLRKRCAYTQSPVVLCFTHIVCQGCQRCHAGHGKSLFSFSFWGKVEMQKTHPIFLTAGQKLINGIQLYLKVCCLAFMTALSTLTIVNEISICFNYYPLFSYVISSILTSFSFSVFHSSCLCRSLFLQKCVLSLPSVGWY